MSKGHTKRNIKKSRSKQKVSRNRTKRTRKQRGGVAWGSIAINSLILSSIALIGAHVMQLSNDTGNRNRNGDMDMEVLSRQLGHGDLNQSFTQEANEEYRKLIVGGDGINKDDFDGMCNVMELVTKW